MNQHRLDAESALRLLPSLPAGPERDYMTGVAQVHATLALAYETEEVAMAARGETRIVSDPGTFDPRFRPDLPTPCPVDAAGAAEWLRRAIVVYQRGDLTDDDLKKHVVDASVSLTGCPF